MTDTEWTKGAGPELAASGPPCWPDDQLRKLLDKLPAGAYTCDADGLITYFNHHAVEMWGRAPARNEPRDRY